MSVGLRCCCCCCWGVVESEFVASNQVGKEDVGPSESEERGEASELSIIDSVVFVSCVASSMLVLVVGKVREVLLRRVIAVW